MRLRCATRSTEPRPAPGLTLSGNDVPATVFAKTTPTRPIERLFHNVYGPGETEAVFYRLVAPEIAECTPAVYGTQWDAHTGRSVVMIEDLAARDIRFADTAVACTADEAAIMARTLAGLQRRYWDSPRFGSDLARPPKESPFAVVRCLLHRPAGAAATPVRRHRLRRFPQGGLAVAHQAGQGGGGLAIATPSRCCTATLTAAIWDLTTPA